MPQATARQGRWTVCSLILAGSLGVLAGCSGSAPETGTEPAPTPPATQAQAYELKGKVVSVDRSAKTITVDGEAIAGFMNAMTMTYGVRDEHLLDNVTAGDQVTARLVVEGRQYLLETITVTGKS